jgi:hypothetical protein
MIGAKPTTSVRLSIWEFYGWNQDTSMSDLLSRLREDPLTDVSICSLTEFPNVYEVDQPYRGTAVASSLDQLVNAPKLPQILRLQPAHLPPILHSGTTFPGKAASQSSVSTWNGVNKSARDLRCGVLVDIWKRRQGLLSPRKQWTTLSSQAAWL